MRVATWNVNSVRARQERLLAWLARRQPDVVCLQELKVEEAQFPFEAVRAAGYHAAVHGQRTYNGVAILAREEPRDVVRGLGDDADDFQARFIAATILDVRVMSVYAPNGGAVGTDKWSYKLDWMRRLAAYLEAHQPRSSPAVVCGDLNVAPEPRDVHNPGLWEDTVLYHPDARAAFERLRAWGLVDAFRLHHQEEGLYSWWDYRMLAFPKNNGLRIDHLLVTEPLRSRCSACSIDRGERKGRQPSDHAPVMADFD